MPSHFYRVISPRPLILEMIALVFCFSFQASAQTQDSALPQYTLAVFVEKSRSVTNQGHVFVQLSDGENSLYRGFHPIKDGRPFAEGEIRDDTGHAWDVKSKTYHLTTEGYENALRTLLQIRANGEKYDVLTHNCGDFVQAIVSAAGVNVQFPGPNGVRVMVPDEIANYLSAHGGVVNQSGESRDASGASFDPSKLTPAEYEGWQRNQAIVRDETLARSDTALHLQELRRKAAQADADLSDAQAELEQQESAGKPQPSSTPDPGLVTGDSLQPSGASAGAETGAGGSLPNTHGWVSPRNYVCKTGPCTLEEWTKQATSAPPRQPPNPQSTPTWWSPRNYTCNFGPCTLEEWQKQNSPAQPKQQRPQQSAPGATQNQSAQPASPQSPPPPKHELGSNPDFAEANKRCNQIFASLPRRTAEAQALQERDNRACYRAKNGDWVCPPQPEDTRRAFMVVRGLTHYQITCNKYADGSYVNALGPSRGALWPTPPGLY